MVAVHLHTDHLGTAVAEEFERDAPRTGKEVERRSSLKVDVAHHHIEDILLCEVCRGSRLE